MASSEDIARVRLFIAEPDALTGAKLSDITIGDFIDEAENVELAASVLWGVKAANVASWYNVSIDGASLSREAVWKHCMEMSKYYATTGGSHEVVSLLLTTDAEDDDDADSDLVIP